MHRCRRRIAIAATLFAAVWFLGLAIIAHHNPMGWLDSAVLREMLASRTSGVTVVATVLTDTFSPSWVGIWTVIAGGILMLRDRGALRGLGLIGTVAIAGFVCEILKLAINRHRPPPVDQLPPPELAMSFPSGHVTGAAALTFAIAHQVMRSGRRLTRYIAAVTSAAVAVGVAVTRLYLGVHWFSDVTAALVIAAAAALIGPLLIEQGLLRLTPHLSDRWRRLLVPYPVSHPKG